MRRLKQLGSPNQPDDGIEDAEFEEIDASQQIPPRRDVDRPPEYTIAEWWEDMHSFKKVIAVGGVLAVCLFIADQVGIRERQPAQVQAAANVSAQAENTPAETLVSPGEQPARIEEAKDLAQLIDPTLKPGDKFQMDTDTAAPSGADHQCNRRTVYQYYFNHDGPGTYISWFNSPTAPKMALGESGTYRLEGGRLSLTTVRATIAAANRDGSVRNIEVPEKDLQSLESTAITVGADGAITFGGAKFRRCNGYF